MIRFALYMLICLALTLILEAAAARLLLIRSRDAQKIIFWANLMTNPAVTLLSGLMQGMSLAGPWILLPLELCAVLAEGFVYRRSLNSIRLNPYLFSLILNLFSYTAGLLIFRIYGLFTV